MNKNTRTKNYIIEIVFKENGLRHYLNNDFELAIQLSKAQIFNDLRYAEYIAKKLTNDKPQFTFEVKEYV